MAVLEQDRDDVKSHRKTHQQCLVDEHILDKYRWMFTSLPRMQGGSWGVSPTDVVVHGLDQEDWFYGEQVRVHLGIQIDEWMQHINKPVLVERK